MTPSSPLGESARSPAASKQQIMRQRAVEIVALSSLCSASSTGSLQHDHVRRLAAVLEHADQETLDDYRAATTGESRDKHWVRPLLKAEKAIAKQQSAVSSPAREGKWRLKRGTWSYDEGEQPSTCSAAEALDRFVAAEEAREHPPYRGNGVCGPPGHNRRWQVRNQFGGFYST